MKDGVAVNNIMGVMNKNVPGESNDRRRKKDPVGSLWQSLREIVENEDGQ